MKKWQDFVLWILCFVGLDTFFDFIKSLTEQGVLNMWAFPIIGFIIFVLSWVAVFFVAKALKNKKIKKTEHRESFYVLFIWFVLFLSVFIMADMMRYFLENNMLNIWCFMVMGICFMFIGWAGGRLDNLLLKPKKRK